MRLQYHLSFGHSQNLLIDTINEEIFYLPKEIDSIDAVVNEYTDYHKEGFEEMSMDCPRSVWVEFLEVDYNPKLIHSVFELASNCLTDYLLIRVHNQEDLETLVQTIGGWRDAGRLALRKVHLSADFELHLSGIAEDQSGFITILRQDNIDFTRKIALQNFKAYQQVIIQAQSFHLFYHSRLFIDKNGFIKPTKNAICSRFPVQAFASRHKELVADPELTQYWNVTKDQIAVCRDCEFKDICIDADELIQTASNEYKRSVPCPYNPYLGKWQSELALGDNNSSLK